MARAIDAEKYMELLKEQYLHNMSMHCAESARAWQGAMQLLYDMPTLTPQNEPLTIEQLREMDGKPVYAPETNCWALITKNQFVPLFTWPDGEQCSAHDWYEQVGPVYRRPPERQEDT